MSVDPRLMERRKTVAEDNAKKNMSRLLKFLAFVLIVGAAVWLVFSPWLSVQQVTTSGISASDGHAVLVSERVTAGTPMILVSSSRVEEALLEDPWVAEARVGLDWPDRVDVEVVERTPAAWVRTSEGWTRRAVDGVALPSESEPDTTLAHIDMPELGQDTAAEDGDLLAALEFAAALPGDLETGTVVSVIDGELWASVSDYRVRLGRAVEMTEKALSLDALLRRGVETGSTITLIAPTNPATMKPSTVGEDPVETTTEGSEDEGNPEEEAGEGEKASP